MSRPHRLVLQLYAGGVLIAALCLGHAWPVLLAGALLLPIVAEYPSFRAVPDLRARPDGWTQADEIMLRARERWALLLRRAFWVAWELGWIAADRIGARFEGDDRVTARALAIGASLLLLVAAGYLSRRPVSRLVVRQAEAAVRAEARFPA
jgi:hypothetical protein